MKHPPARRLPALAGSRESAGSRGSCGSLEGYRIHMVGIKGTGMTALAEILAGGGAVLTGSDVPEHFYTDEILKSLGIPYRESFSASNLGPEVQLVIHSAAYSPEENCELQAASERGLPLLTYPEALGELSRGFDASGIAGTHGKTSTTAMAGAVLSALGLPVTVLAGSEVAGFGGRSALVLGGRFLVAETCEYRRHFLAFHPRRIVLTSVEEDHLDYYRDLEDVRSAFLEYCLRLPPDGLLVYCHDDAGARRVAEAAQRERPSLRLLPYGVEAEGPYRVCGVRCEARRTVFGLESFAEELSVPAPGRHSALNAAAAVALSLDLLAESGAEPGGGRGAATTVEVQEKVRRALEGFAGMRRRSEVLGTAGGVLFVDDYGHHPTEIARTLEGLRAFYPGRRLVVDFMSHTYSRTRRLLGQFGRSFASADLVVLHRIYASARERDAGEIRGADLFEEVRKNHPRVEYFENPEDAVPFLLGELKAGDLFVTMGAGDNWKVGQAVMRRMAEGTE
ncbi:MAG: UDP-N-acetylmuramate--L-alanine ligase [Spirochaetales bacterium]|nr:UDP-N-acetylmuramate--L-alanine ligase [Spirochaetales bacterium]